MKNNINIFHTTKYSMLYGWTLLCMLSAGIAIELSPLASRHSSLRPLIHSYVNFGQSPTLRLTCSVVDLSHMLA